MKTRIAAALTVLAALTLMATNAATATATEPTTITYHFASDTRAVDNVFWIDQNNNNKMVPAANSASNHYATLPNTIHKKAQNIYTARISIKTQNPDQMIGSLITAKNGTWVACATYIGNKQIAYNEASGRGAEAICERQ